MNKSQLPLSTSKSDDSRRNCSIPMIALALMTLVLCAPWRKMSTRTPCPRKIKN